MIRTCQGHTKCDYCDSAMASGSFSIEKWQKLCCFYSSHSHERDCIDIYGVKALFEDAGIEATDPAALVFAYYCGCKTQGTFSIDEFRRGCSALAIDSKDKLKSVIPELRWKILDPDICREIYMFTFPYHVERDEKTLPCRVCCQYWEILLKPHFPHYDEWIQFIETARPGPISKDTWKLVFEFATKFDQVIEEYDPGGAWPVQSFVMFSYIESFPEYKAKSEIESL
ncbi:DUF298 domain-containing protein [Cardiosporidium cionae]|uniref:Defective in cullin neddylation protein n=1 Tax=Cardiosporidium cionae TaxID=476202 RepID=A0ABQ7J769_9APIC|nr:DUF298 domain-containing protein [Cardiosporidium cionae]|eukprot:KAF8819829.1 DUF298 domain-containing protein [Cardiosporidium cionae]